MLYRLVGGALQTRVDRQLQRRQRVAASSPGAGRRRVPSSRRQMRAVEAAVQVAVVLRLDAGDPTVSPAFACA